MKPHDDEVTGLPVLRTWGAVYRFIIVLFLVYIVLLAAFARFFR